MFLSHRDRLVRTILSLNNTLNEEKEFIAPIIHAELEAINRPAILQIQLVIKNLESKIETLLSKDVQLKRQAEIVASIPGFGIVIGSKLIQILLARIRNNTTYQKNYHNSLA